ncbi:MAG: hypothetical protein IPP33_13985 [Flavobacteriales bacterium]|nr:hypothetical protein [Flavobacteriales bacterium]
MDAEEYMTSGILQDYCLGLLTAEEEREVEAMCQAFPRVQEELRSLRLALEDYATSDEVKPPTELRNTVWQAVKKLWEENE